MKGKRSRVDLCRNLRADSPTRSEAPRAALIYRSSTPGAERTRHPQRNGAQARFALDASDAATLCSPNKRCILPRGRKARRQKPRTGQLGVSQSEKRCAAPSSPRPILPICNAFIFTTLKTPHLLRFQHIFPKSPSPPSCLLSQCSFPCCVVGKRSTSAAGVLSDHQPPGLPRSLNPSQSHVGNALRAKINLCRFFFSQQCMTQLTCCSG